MRTVFIGCVESSRRTAEKLIASAVLEVVGVVTKQQSNFNADFCSLVDLADKCGIPHFVDNANDQERLVPWLTHLQPDVVFCVGWPYLLKDELLAIPPRGTIGYHPSDLPHNRGRHPIIWALVLGLERTASTFFMMDTKADAGPIIDKVLVDIRPDDSAADLYARLMEQAELQVVRVARALVSNNVILRPQSLHVGNVWRKRGKQDGRIDWRMSSAAIHNLVRALSHPYPGAHCETSGGDIKIWRVRPKEYKEKNIEPGKVIRSVDGRLIVKTGDGAIEIMEHEFLYIPSEGTYL